jgi:hypothetical protein
MIVNSIIPFVNDIHEAINYQTEETFIDNDFEITFLVFSVSIQRIKRKRFCILNLVNLM